MITKLHLGCGRNILRGWINTDSNCKADARGCTHLDVTKKFPYDDNSVGYIFSEHLIEHLSLRDGRFMLEECFRVLESGGKIRTSTPDLKFFIELYNENKTDLQKRYIDYTINHPAYDVSTEVDTYIINNFVRAWGHTFIYDEKSLKSLLESVGFTDVKSYLINDSEDEHLKNLENSEDKTNVEHGLTSEILQMETFTLEATK